MEIIEAQPGFDPQVKIKDIDTDKTGPAKTVQTPVEPCPTTETVGAVGAMGAMGAMGGEEFDGAGLAMFNEPEPDKKPKPKGKIFLINDLNFMFTWRNYTS